MTPRIIRSAAILLILLAILPSFPTQALAPVYLSAPADLPHITVNTPANGAADGYLFVSNFDPNAFFHAPNPGSYLLILDNSGQLVYYQSVPATTYATDFKVLPNGLLAYWQDESYHLEDRSYNAVMTLSAPPYGLDPHDLLALPDGHLAYLLFDYRVMDLSKTVPGGKTDAIVNGTILQEVDADGNVVFQWDSFDHIPVTDSNQDLTAAQIDYMHPNALILDSDGNFLLSSRHLDEVTKIDRHTGAVIWRMGGKANQFSFSADPAIQDIPQFYYQHDIQLLSNGHLTVFDNHNLHDSTNSRALEYTIDERQMTAKLVWEYRNNPEVASSYMGSVQRLANGNTLIGWGGVSSPALTEVKPDGSKALEISFDAPYTSYRVVRFPWHGRPTWPPALALQPGAGSLTLAMSWNGATDIARYQVFAGNAAQPGRKIAEPARTGFETTVTLTGADAQYCDYWVMPINTQGKTTLYSHVAKNMSCIP